MQVRGCALAARAAAGLEAAAGIPAMTLDGLLRRLDRADIVLVPHEVVVIDEAAMVGTRKLHRVLDHADRARAKVVLIGDPRQLPEIDAGGEFSALHRAVGAVTLTSNRRQVQQWERDALAQLRSGLGDEALAEYRCHERIHEASDAYATMVTAWLDDRVCGGSGLMLAARVIDVEALNRQARSLLQQRALLGSDEVILGDRAFAARDEIVALRNAYAIGVLNGTRLRVRRIDLVAETLHCDDANGRPVRIPFDYARDGQLSHGYAMTIHKAQGVTVARALVLVDDSMASEHLYTALSRARDRTDLYLDTGARDHQEAHSTVVELTTAERLRNVARRLSRQALAIERRRGRSL